MKEKIGSRHLKRRKLRFLPLLSVLNLFPGDYQSIFKGEGEDFVDLRPYQSGDDAKRIDWPHYAKTRSLFVVERVVPKNLTIVSAIDLSKSMYWSERKIDTIDTFLEILIGSLIWSGSNSLGCLGFSGGIEGYFLPRAGKAHFAQILRWYLSYIPKEPATNIPKALDFIAKKVRPRSLVFFISDFFDKRDFEKELKVVAQNFDFIPVVVCDPRELLVFPGVRVNYCDSETGKTETLWLTKKKAREIAAAEESRQEKLKNLFRRNGLDPIYIDSPEENDLVRAICNFFERRSKKKRG